MCFCGSARDMALLAEEVCVCRVELLSGGMGGDNSRTILTHLCEGQPVLIPDPSTHTHAHTHTHTHTLYSISVVFC